MKSSGDLKKGQFPLLALVHASYFTFSVYLIAIEPIIMTANITERNSMKIVDLILYVDSIYIFFTKKVRATSSLK